MMQSIQLRSAVALSAFLFVAVLLATAIGAEAASHALELRFEHQHFTPQTLRVPAGKPLALKVVNASKETIEFESFRLDRERVVTPGETITVHLPALQPGSYDFYDDFHQNVPQGAIVARQQPAS